MRGGAYFIESGGYVRSMRQVVDLYPDDDVGFVVVSDEPQDATKFPELEVYMGTGFATGSGHYIENMFELSRCDAVMSVPSTFSAIAAFLGNIPIFPIEPGEGNLEFSNVLQSNSFDARNHSSFSVAVK